MMKWGSFIASSSGGFANCEWRFQIAILRLRSGQVRKSQFANCLHLEVSPESSTLAALDGSQPFAHRLFFIMAQALKDFLGALAFFERLLALVLLVEQLRAAPERHRQSVGVVEFFPEPDRALQVRRGLFETFVGEISERQIVQRL